MKQKEKQKTDFAGVQNQLMQAVLPMLMEKCGNPLEAICILTSFAKNAALTMGITAGQPPKNVIKACIAIFEERNYNDQALTAMAAMMQEKIKEKGVSDLNDAIAAVDEITGTKGN